MGSSFFMKGAKMEELVIYNRADIVNFFNTGTTENPVWTRMQGFTEMPNELNTQTYSRRYVDERTERESVIGYSKSIGYSFDRVTSNAVHNKIAKVHDDEEVGVTCEILTVNLKTNSAKRRTYDIIPDTDGDGTDAYQYSGSFHAVGEGTTGTATVSANGMTATFTETVSG